MAPPMPVPSKAAIHALRGLALGTSCAIGAIVEDRRRRISTLQTAVANKEKLRSARRYRSDPDEAALWTPFDEEAVAVKFELSSYDQPIPVGSLDLYADSPLGIRNSKRDHRAKTMHARDSNDRADKPQPVSPLESKAKDPPRRKRFDAPILMPPAPKPISSLRTWGRSMSTLSQPINLAAIIESVQTELGKTQSGEVVDEESIDRAVADFKNGSRGENAYTANGKAWRQTSAALARQCQRMGKWDYARDILNLAMQTGTIEEAEFYAHHPFAIIRHLVSPGEDGTPCTRDNFMAAMRLFTVRFPETPHMYSTEVRAMGQDLLAHAMRLHHAKSLSVIYWRILPQMEGADFIGWYIRSLFHYGAHKDVVKIFLLNYCKQSPRFQCFQDTIDCVVVSVEKTGGNRADQVLKAYTQMGNVADGKLRSRWVMRLLHAHWNHHKDIKLSQDLFEDIKAQGLLQRTAHPQGSYRAIIEFALRARQDALAQRYHDEAVDAFQSMRTDIPIQGYFALRKAQEKDWETVDKLFTVMRGSPQYQTQMVEFSQAFVPVLKEFASSHDVVETRSFLDKYTSEHGVQLDSWMMTLVANKYGNADDMIGFLSWLEHCFNTGVTLDANFCNVVLDNCRTRWKMPYPQLQKLSDRMKTLHPESFDEVTRRILRAAASASSNGSSRPLHNKALTVGRKALSGRTANPREIYDAMNHNMTAGKHPAALATYKRAIDYGMPHSEGCLRLAVVASFSTPGGHKQAFELIKEAHEAKNPVGSAVTLYVKHELERVRGNSQTVLRRVQHIVRLFEDLGINLDPEALANMAITLVKLGQHDQAMTVTRLAMDRAGTTDPCFSRQSFRAHLLIYSQTFDTKGLDGLIAAIPESDLAADRYVMDQLKSSRRQIQGLKLTEKRKKDASVKILTSLQHGIDVVKNKRASHQDNSAQLSEETLRIMSDAVSQMEKSKLQAEEQREAEKEFEHEQYQRPEGTWYMMRMRLDGDTEKSGYRISSRPDTPRNGSKVDFTLQQTQQAEEQQCEQSQSQSQSRDFGCGHEVASYRREAM